MGFSNFLTVALLQFVSLRVLLDKGMALRLFPCFSPSAFFVKANAELQMVK